MHKDYNGLTKDCNGLTYEKTNQTGGVCMESKYRFINEFEYNEATTNEVINAWWDARYRRSVFMQAVCLAASLGLMIWTKSLIYLGIIALDFGAFGLLVSKKKKAIKVEQERMEVAYKTLSFKVIVSINENIRIATSFGVTTVEPERVESFTLTKNYIVLMMKGSMTIAINRQGFTKGTEEEFMDYLKNTLKLEQK